jgi:cytochrome P450
MTNLSTGTRPNVLPGPPARGNLSATWRFARFMLQPFPTFQRHLSTYGPVSGLTGAIEPGGQGLILAIGPQYNQQVLSNPTLFYNMESRNVPKTSAAWRLAQGVVYLNGEHHRQQRRLIMPAFHKKEIDRYAEAMMAATERLLAGWQPGQRINLIDEMTRLTMNVVLQTLFGLDAEQEGHALGLLLEEWLTLSGTLGAHLIPAGVPGSPVRRLMRVSEQIEAQTFALLAQKKVTLAASHDVLSTLMRTQDEDGSQLTEAEVIGNAVVLFLAGHETSANALSWALFLLSQHPDVARELYAELDAQLGGQPPRLDQLSNLPLLDGVINEALRLFPPLAYIMRKAQEPFAMDGYHVAANSSVMISHYMTHRLPAIYEEPDRFLPQRWFTLKPSPYEYIPFSAGPRFCIGAQFALLEMKLVLAMIMQRCRLAPPPNALIKTSINFLLRVKQMPMVVHPQDGQFTKTPVRGDVLKLMALPE